MGIGRDATGFSTNNSLDDSQLVSNNIEIIINIFFMAELYIVATPIGNLNDITIRALETLRHCEIILCEDTRITLRLLQKYDIKNKKLVVYNDNSDKNVRKRVLDIINSGMSVALVSDAGTPLISDPGYKLVSFIKSNNIKVIPIPGPSSLISSLSASGIAVENFLFLGFLPSSSIQRKKSLKNISRNTTFSFFESPNRIIETLVDLDEIFLNPKVCIARELTKIHEEIITDSANNLIKLFTENPDKVRGEFVVIVEKVLKDFVEISNEELEREIKEMLKINISLKDISSSLSDIYKINKKDVYKKTLKIINN